MKNGLIKQRLNRHGTPLTTSFTISTVSTSGVAPFLRAFIDADAFTQRDYCSTNAICEASHMRWVKFFMAGQVTARPPLVAFATTSKPAHPSAPAPNTRSLHLTYR